MVHGKLICIPDQYFLLSRVGASIMYTYSLHYSHLILEYIANICIYIYIYAHAYVNNICVYIYIYVCIYIYIYIERDISSLSVLVGTRIGAYPHFMATLQVQYMRSLWA